MRQSPTKKEGSLWFRRLIEDCKNISHHIRIKRIKYGFYRIYWRQAYLHEIYKELPQKGYDMDSLDPRLESQKYYEEYEDYNELPRKIKNFVEGYWDSLDHIKTRVYLMRNNKEFNENAHRAYRQMKIR